MGALAYTALIAVRQPIQQLSPEGSEYSDSDDAADVLTTDLDMNNTNKKQAEVERVDTVDVLWHLHLIFLPP